VARVIDGDTIELTTGEVVRYIGIDTPELNSEGAEDDECLAWLARLRNMELLGMGNLKLVEDPTAKTDKYGRLLRYVYINDLFINEVLAKEGLAEIFFCQPDWENCPVSSDKTREDMIRASNQDAKNSLRGIYSGVCEEEVEPKKDAEKFESKTEEKILEDDFLLEDNVASTSTSRQCNYHACARQLTMKI
jgi:micrococcal nuclease